MTMGNKTASRSSTRPQVGHHNETICNRCGSHDVRWRQQGGRWVLFSLQPGKEHVCPVKDEFDALD